MYAEVVLDHQLSKLHDSFCYAVPMDMELKLGQIVLVPFGPIRQRGIVVRLNSAAPAEVKGIKAILKISESEAVLAEWQLKLAYWISEYYACALIDAVKLLLPLEIWKGQDKAHEELQAKLLFPMTELAAKLETLKRAPKQVAALETLSSGGKVETALLKKLAEKGLIKLEKVRVWRSLTNYYQNEPDVAHQLTPQQEQVLQAFLTGSKQVALLHGITSSGKTEIYLRAMAECLQAGKQAIYLVPEIALTPQAIQRVSNRFPGQVAVWHHRLSAGEKSDEWRRIQSGTAKVIVGSRSALFTPATKLGLIVIDEEHEGSYKQDRSPRYLARTVAEQMARLTGAKVLLGSATPSVESYFQAMQGNYHLLELPERIGNGTSLPPIEIVDLRDEFKKRNYSYFSDKLQQYIVETFKQGGQVMLFLNRRGSASGLLCRDCGWRSNCPHCEISLTVHGNKFLCHYCGYEALLPVKCPKCASVAIKTVGVGTQKLEWELQRLFPKARILRADSDTTGGKESHNEIYHKFKNYEADVLIGTQMIAKGWDLPRVHLVGIIIADIGLNMPDFRAAERVFSLITQVAGRAGRGAIPGRVVLQTYDPEHEAVRFGSKHDYRAFYENEIKVRETFHYPPFVRLLRLVHVDLNEGKALLEAKRLAELLRQQFPKLEALGPAPAYPPKLYNKYHFEILLKIPEEAELESLLKLIPPVGWRVDLD